MYIKITNGGVSYKDKTILEEINIEIKDSDHIAIIGRNGCGKTTLLKALIDNELFETGIGEEKFNIFKNGKYEIGYLNQNNKINAMDTLLDCILEVYKPIIKLENRIKQLEGILELGATEEEIEEYEASLERYKIMGGYEYKKEYLTALDKFGFNGLESKLIKDFSGGEKTKIIFLKLLLSKPDLLLLDEPTNHLDIESVLWLEEYLKKYKKTFIVVSHDRAFINHTVNKIIEIEYGKTTEYLGNYEYYKKEKKRIYDKVLKDYEYQQKEIKRLQSIANRFRYKPSKASMAMSKLKQIEHMTKLSSPEKENLKTFNMHFDNMLPSGKVVLSVKNLKIGYENIILNTCSFELERGRKLGIIGENGIGKSTLLKTIMGAIPNIDGDFTFGHNVTIGYFDQELNNLDENLNIYDEIASKFPELNDFEIRKTLASFLFYNEDLDKVIKVLSGGEKVRLELCEVLMKKPNLLILDEPTNHLDMLSINRLESILKSYPGTCLFVSHDRYFINEVADSLLEFTKEKTNYYDLTYEEYLVLKQDKPVIEKTKDNKEKIKKEPNKDNKKKINKLEKEISTLENEIKDLKESLFKPEIYNDYNKSLKVKQKIEEEEEKLIDLTNKWEEYIDL